MMKDWIEFLKQARVTVEERFNKHEDAARANHGSGQWELSEFYGGKASEDRFWEGYFSARLHTATLYPVIRILRDGQPVAEFTDASLARMAAVMFAENEAANGNAVHQWTVEGE